MSVEVKICGLSTPDTVSTAIDAGADLLGFIFFPKSPRNVSPQLAGELTAAYKDQVETVAVTVNADDAFLDEIVTKMQPSMLQLHGTETPARVAEIKERFSLPVMKAISVREAKDFAKAEDYYSVADRLLFDAKPPAGADLPGGNGVSFDWQLFCDWQESQNSADKPRESDLSPMLSGGINSDNVQQALSVAKARAIDLSSGVESAPGVKDPDRIRALMHTIKPAN